MTRVWRACRRLARCLRERQSRRDREYADRAYRKAIGTPGYDTRPDFNEDGTVGISVASAEELQTPR